MKDWQPTPDPGSDPGAWSVVLLPGVEGLDGQAIQLFMFRLPYRLADLLLNWGSLPLYSTGTCHMAQL